MYQIEEWCKELSDATESLEEEGLLLALLCVECCAPSPRGSVEVRLRCLERLEDYREQHLEELRCLVRFAPWTE